MSKKLKNYSILIKALSNFSLVNLNVNVLRKGESVFKKVKETSAKIFYDPYLSFIEENNEPFTLKTSNTSKNWSGTLEYSTDTQDWSKWDGTEISSSNDGKLYLRGTGNKKITGSSGKQFVLTSGKHIQCLGNIENLLDYKMVESGKHPAMADSCYCYMFDNCTSLTVAPELPATALTVECYSSMFQGCTSLIVAPELPVTTLTSARYCYSHMFEGCTSLTQAPELPATTLAAGCYADMFQGCTSLTTAPNLPATELTYGCYNSMFENCISLTQAPELPATTLADACYSEMFRDCTSLTTAPELPATTLTGQCYYSMFSGCTSLTKAPERLPATTLTKNSYSMMFTWCDALSGTIHCPASTANNDYRLDKKALISYNTATVVYDL